MTSDNTNKQYKPTKIPSPVTVQGIGVSKPLPISKPRQDLSLSDDAFYEVQYDSAPIPATANIATKPQRIAEPKKDNIRELFYLMREISAIHQSTYDPYRFFDRRVQNQNSIVFYKQGIFMKDFEDDYSDTIEFSQYFPSYQMMGYKQLRTYFTWRTKVRTKTVPDTSLSYFFLYIYELIANIGVASPEEGLKQLLFVWSKFREFNPGVDKYVLSWVKDYYIYYNLSGTWAEFVQEQDLSAYYTDTESDDFDLFSSISRYNIKKSKFYSDETKDTISECFMFVIEQVRLDFEAKGIHFDDALFRPTKRLNSWKPFKDALFYDYKKQPNRSVVISKNEIYICKNNIWAKSNNLTSEKGRQFIGYVMKQTESVLRRIKNYTYKLTANIDMIHEETLRILTKAGLSPEKIVTAAVINYHREATKTVVTVDMKSLDRIRREALITQEALMVEEQNRHGDSQPAVFLAQNQDVFSDLQEPTPVFDTNEWDFLRDALTETEIDALTVIAGDGDIKAFADKTGVMLEVLADGINEKATDIIGDSLMDDDFVLYDDYKDNVDFLINKQRN